MHAQVRLGALECLQRSVVAAEKFAIPPEAVQVGTVEVPAWVRLHAPLLVDICMPRQG